jgi:hypothetical protein
VRCRISSSAAAVAAEEFERFLERAKPLESDLTLDLE